MKARNPVGGKPKLSLDRVLTVGQIADKYPIFTQPSLRWLIFNARENGLDDALIRIGRRVLIDLDRFERWLDAHRATEKTA